MRIGHMTRDERTLLLSLLVEKAIELRKLIAELNPNYGPEYVRINTYRAQLEIYTIMLTLITDYELED